MYQQHVQLTLQHPVWCVGVSTACRRRSSSLSTQGWRGSNFIVQFTCYKHAASWRRRLAHTLGSIPHARWRWVARRNRAASLRTDFALLEVHQDSTTILQVLFAMSCCELPQTAPRVCAYRLHYVTGRFSRACTPTASYPSACLPVTMLTGQPWTSPQGDGSHNQRWTRSGACPWPVPMAQGPDPRGIP